MATGRPPDLNEFARLSATGSAATASFEQARSSPVPLASGKLSHNPDWSTLRHVMNMGRTERETADERAALTAALDGARQAVVGTLTGVPIALLSEPLISPDSSLLGVVKHLAALERWWFAYTFAGLDVDVPWAGEGSDTGWRLQRSDTARNILELYGHECQRSVLIVRHAALDGVAARPSPVGRRVVLRWLVLHMLAETGRHLGHAEVLRHLIDGAGGSSPWASPPWVVATSPATPQTVGPLHVREIHRES
jgi:Protein of unknown function (DUF664)